MEVNVSNRPHIVIRHRSKIDTEVLLKSISVLIKRHQAVNSTIEIFGKKLFLVNNPDLAPELTFFHLMKKASFNLSTLRYLLIFGVKIPRKTPSNISIND